MRTAPAGGGPFKIYKPEQGKYTRLGTFAGALAVIAWGTYFIWDHLGAFRGSGTGLALVLTNGVPLLFGAGMLALAGWAIYSNRKASDFLISTDGEMKKVNWSSRREVIGSTKVVIAFTLLLAAVLFVYDTLFVALFRLIGVLHT